MNRRTSSRRVTPPHASVRRLTTFVTMLVVSVPLIASCGIEGSDDADATGVRAGITRVEPGDRKQAPEISGDDLDGAPLSLASFKGKVVVVNIWGSWCPPCREEQPALSKLATDLKPQGVEFIGIAVREGAATSKAYTEENNVPYPSISDSGGKLLIGFTSSLPAVAVPTTYVIDREGRVATRLLDVATEPTLGALITEIVEEP